MKKKLKKNTNKKTPRKIGGWLIVVLIILLCSAISAFSLLIQKINAIATKNTGFGVYISAILLVFYLFFLCSTICLILNKKKKAIKTFIVTAIAGIIFPLWYYLIGILIFYPNQKLLIWVNNIINIIINIAIMIAILLYLLKSKRVKETLKK